MIIMDLEWNRGYDKNPLNEILQIGAVRLDRLGGPITGSFNVYIRPVVHRRFDRMAKQLPDLPLSKASRHSFAQAFSAFQAWCGDETVFGAWGGDDMLTLKQSCDYWSVPFRLPERVRDLQAAFSARLGAAQQIALSRAVEYCGIPAPFDYHSALNDALYTAVLGEFLTEELLDWESLDRRTRQLSQLRYPPQPRPRLGPFPTAEAALNNRACRRMACPLCGQRAWVLRWYSAEPGQYFSAFGCPEHGQFPCRLTLSQGEPSGWYGRLAVPAVTPALLYAFDRAVRTAPIPCGGGGKKRRRHRRRAAAQ